MAVIVSIFTVSASARPINHYVRGTNGAGIAWSENIAEALEFANGAAADAFMSGKWAGPYQKTTVAGYVHYGQKSHT